MEQNAEVLIVGGGMAGLAAAAHLARCGRRVLVLDKAALPRDKVCGEGLMPLGLRMVRQLGLEPASVPGAPFRGLEYRSRRRTVQLDFPPGVLGRGMRRTALLAALLQRCGRSGLVAQVADRARAPLWQRGRVVGVRGEHGCYGAAVVLAADGVQSGLARRAGAALRIAGERMALRRHYQLNGGALPQRVGVGLFAPHDVYLTPVGDGTLLATTMTDRAGYRAIVDRYDAFLRESPFGECFAGAAPVSSQLGWHHPLFTPDRYVVGGMLLVGDAGGGVDPCLGLGVSMAFVSALDAAEVADRMLSEPERRAHWEAEFQRRRKTLFRHFNAFGRVFRFAVRSRRGSDWLMAGMQHWPRVAEGLLDIVATGRPWRSFPWPALLEPAWPVRDSAG